MEDKGLWGYEIKKIASDCFKTVEQAVCGEFEKQFVMKSGRDRMEALVRDLTNEWRASGYCVQTLRFEEGDETGTLVQIGQKGGHIGKIVTVAAGQQMAVCVKMLPLGEDLSIWIGCGKWLDKVFSGVVSWALLPPLLVLPLAGVWRQKSMMENVLHDVLIWFANHPPTDVIEQEEDDDGMDDVALFCEKMAQADWVREEAAMGGPHANGSGSLNFKLDDQVTLQLVFCPVGAADGYWSSLTPVTMEQWKALMPEVQWEENMDDEIIDKSCVKLSKKYLTYMPKGYSFQWRRTGNDEDKGFLVVLDHEH